MALTPHGFGELISVSRETLTRLELHAALLQKWQKAINLVSNDSLDYLWQRHMVDSAQLADLIPSDRPINILDMGSGAGFPGMVLAILASDHGRQ